ncbi:hypothetical protein OEZ85_008090 [Tetradesmus obliquus]|uniref:ubiquitinyl hydrolase 1 n=1 Tax=Tetradesmus obliquus TaxID=3088 RepID=A0ABY8TJV5_TETOB|nr:hypothetical protein OEZ85_008090 [Tetradesmus obliquus]
MPPGRKAKGKQGEGLDANEARLALQLLDLDQQLPRETLLKVFKLGQTPCPPACGTKGKGSKDNPECFHGLMPAEGSFRKKGLWQKEPILGQLGHDPADDKRQAPDVPAGLRNLGNTCYVNAAMQFLQAIPEFRHALYVLEPHLAEQDVIRQLRDLFIELHFGPRRYVDPEPFANSLQLNHAIQQDGQEFLKLLLTKLEHTFASSAQQEVRGVVQTLFRGHFSYVTTCRSCGQQSAGSARKVEYYELPLQVQGMASLRHSMASALAPEELVGDNQYLCENCGCKCDAERQMQLRSLPPYLCLSLQRFVFDMQTFEKKKASNKLSIPLLLDMGETLTAAGVALPCAAPAGPDGARLLPGSPGCVYELAAVLIHKGTSASHGHYVAHIKMPDSGSWWRFDDETAEEMGTQPTSFPADHGTTAQAQGAAADKAGAADGAVADASAGAEASAAGSTGKKRGRGGGAAGSSKRGRGGGGGGRGPRKTRDEEDSDYEAHSKAKGSKSRARGRVASSAGRGSSAGKGRSRKAAADGAGAYDEEAAIVAAMQQSLHDVEHEVQQQRQILASFGQAEQQQLQQQQQPGADAMDCDVPQAEAAPQEERGRRKRNAAEPAAAAADAADSATAKKKAGRGKAAAAAAAGDDADVKAEPDAGAAASAAEVKQLPDEQVEIVSGNAYFLVYRQRISSIGRAAAPATAPAAAGTADAATSHAAAGAGAAHANGHAAAGSAAAEAGQQVQLPLQLEAGQQVQLPPQLEQQLQALPAAVRQRVQQLHQDFAQACANHQQVKSDALERVKQRQEEVSGISQMLPLSEPGDPGCLISAAWLEAWANSEEGRGPVDNGPLLCSHGALSPDKPPGSFKYLSSTAWEALVGSHQGGPQLRLADVCRECLRQQLQGLVSSDYAAELREQLLAMLADEEEANAAEGRGDADMPGNYVSKTWLKGFRARQGAGGGSLQPPTAGITCCHGRLMPESKSGAARRSVVSAEAWLLLKEVWVMHVVREVGRRRAKAAKAAAERAAAGLLEEAGGAAGDDDGDVKIVDHEADADGDVKIVDVEDTKQEATPAASGDQQQQQQQQQQHISVKEEVDLQDSDNEQQQQQQCEERAGSRATSPRTAAAAAAAAAGSWQLPIPLDGSVEVTEAQLRELLPSFASFQAFDCEVCKASLAEAVVGHQEAKQQLEAQRAALAKLLAGSVNESLDPSREYYLVPNDWVASWRAHVQAVASSRTPGKAALPPAPGPLPAAVRSLLCTCHPDCPGLAAPLPHIVNKRGSSSEDPEGLLVAVTQPGDDDWQPDADDDAGEQQQRSSSRRTRSRPGHKAAAAGRAGNGGSVDADSGAAPAAATAAAAALLGWLETSPEPCQQHLQAAAAARRAALLVYEAAEVMVELVSEQELPAAFTGTGVERKSRRARKNRQPLKVASSDSLAQLRLKVFEALSVHPKNQALYMRGNQLQGEDSTLAQLEVFPGEELRVVNTNEVDNDDYASVFDGVAAGKRRREVETGFKDTALIGCSAARPAVATSAEDAMEAASSPNPAAQEGECAKTPVASGKTSAAGAACDGLTNAST